VQIIHRGRQQQWMTHSWLQSTFIWKKTLHIPQGNCSRIKHFSCLIFTPICFWPTIKSFMRVQGHTLELILGKCDRNCFPSAIQYWQKPNRFQSVFEVEGTNTQKTLQKHWGVYDKVRESTSCIRNRNCPQMYKAYKSA
jgi:hypothetical protein